MPSFKRYLKVVSIGLVSAIMSLSANAALIVEQYNDYWSTDLSALEYYAATYTADTITEWDYIDFTDDPAGFAGDIAGSNPWPSASQAGVTGGSASLNDQFFVRITGDFSVASDANYFFQTYSDDGIFLYIDGELIINDPNLHAEQRRSGQIDLTSGIHSMELYFFENAGEASLELSIASEYSTAYTHFNDVNSVATVVDVPEPASSLLFAIGLLGLASRRLFRNTVK
ncbi:PA14 domain-containing protein [Vibrio sp. MA40-2]|uniref:PA14 domain-containing protein n=1 Tax=Vibrio sp. MA40-2 TaxID=3391828 RepID=UPI0039A4D94D